LRRIYHLLSFCIWEPYSVKKRRHYLFYLIHYSKCIAGNCSCIWRHNVY